MLVGETEVEWDFGWESATELLKSIQLLGTQPGIKRLDGENFKVYWAGNILRIDIDGEFVAA